MKTFRPTVPPTRFFSALFALPLLWMQPAGAAPVQPAKTGGAPKAATPQKPQVGAPQAGLSLNSARGAIFRYQLALDELAAGRPTEARVMLEEAVARYGDRPEWNLLLAYLLQRENRTDEARQRLDAVADTSSLAAPYSAILASQASQASQTPAAAAPPPNKARLRQSDARLARLEQAMAQMVNAERAKSGLNELAFDDDLAEIARAHSAEMRDLKYFAHESPTADLRQPLNRYIAALGATPHVVAENIYSAWGSPHAVGQGDIDTGHQSLMNSPGHRANILYRGITRIGIGIVTNAKGDIWVTQMFSRQ